MGQRLSVYVIFGGFILCWWVLAMHSPKPFVSIAQHSIVSMSHDQKNDLLFFLPLSNLDEERKMIHQALEGNSELMAKLIAEWDIEAQLLHTNRVESKRLPTEKFLNSQRIGKKLKHAPSSKIKSSYLPQTYASASFLLALIEPEQIVALPKGFRDQNNLHASRLTDKIPLDIDNYHAEQLYQMHPEVAFVATYSHPATIETLRDQGIAICTLKDFETFADIQETIRDLGTITHQEMKAELLALFIEAAFYSIDNRLLALKTTLQTVNQRILYLNCTNSYSIPTNKTLMGKLLARLGMNDKIEESILQADHSQWSISISIEQIIQLQPDFLVITVPSKDERLVQKFFEEPAFATLPAIQNQNLYVVDEAIQDSPTQYIVLAYFDLFQAYLQASISPLKDSRIAGDTTK